MSEEAKVVVTDVVKSVVHVCSCDDSHPSFPGVVVGTSISWPVAFERFRMSYCPWCGRHLPHTLPQNSAKKKKEKPWVNH